MQLKNDVLELMELKHRIIIVFKGSHFVTQKLHFPYGADVKVCCSKHSELHATSNIFLASSVQSACILQPVQKGALRLRRRPNTADTTVNQLHSTLVLTVHISDPTDLTRKRPGTHCIGHWMGPRAGLGGCGIFRPHRDSSS